MPREAKARRLLRGLVGRVRDLLDTSPRKSDYAQTYLAVGKLLDEASAFLGVAVNPRHTKKLVHIDVPDSNDPAAPWVCLKTLPRDEAVKYVRETFGADEKGRICLISETNEDEE